MNALQRRQFRRALSTATGIVPGMRLINGKAAKPVTVLQVSPTGARDVLVKHGNNHKGRVSLSALSAIPA